MYDCKIFGAEECYAAAVQENGLDILIICGADGHLLHAFETGGQGQNGVAPRHSNLGESLSKLTQLTIDPLMMLDVYLGFTQNPRLSV